MSERDGAARDASIDVEQRLMMLRGAAKERWKQTVRQIRDQASLKDDTTEVAHGVLIALAYPDRIGRKRGGRYPIVGWWWCCFAGA